MDDEHFNMEIRKFLKMVGVNSQREIENAVRSAVDSRRLSGTEALGVRMQLQIRELDLDFTVEGTIALA